MTLTLLPTRLLHLRRGPVPHQSIPRLKFLHYLMAVVNERKSRTLPTTVLRPEPETRHLVFIGFVEFGELLAEFVFADVGAAGVEDITLQVLC